MELKLGQPPPSSPRIRRRFSSHFVCMFPVVNPPSPLPLQLRYYMSGGRKFAARWRRWLGKTPPHSCLHAAHWEREARDLPAANQMI